MRQVEIHEIYISIYNSSGTSFHFVIVPSLGLCIIKLVMFLNSYFFSYTRILRSSSQILSLRIHVAWLYVGMCKSLWMQEESHYQWLQLPFTWFHNFLMTRSSWKAIINSLLLNAYSWLQGRLPCLTNHVIIHNVEAIMFFWTIGCLSSLTHGAFCIDSDLSKQAPTLKLLVLETCSPQKTPNIEVVRVLSTGIVLLILTKSVGGDRYF